jgi:hypothetical protein
MFYSFIVKEEVLCPHTGIVPVGGGEGVVKGGIRVNTSKDCVQMCVNGKMIPVETVPGMGVGENKGEW